MNLSPNDYLHDFAVPHRMPRMPCAVPQLAPFYTSSPRPFAKTSLGFYNDQPPVYDNVSDGEDEDMETSSETSSGSSTPPTFDAGSGESQEQPTLPVNNSQQFTNNNNMTGFQQPMMPPPSGPLPSFQREFRHIQLSQAPSISSSNLLSNIPLDQHTLQLLMVNPELLAQLNAAAQSFVAAKTMPPPPPPAFPQPVRHDFNMANQAQNSNGNANGMPPPPPHFFPFGCPFPTPIQTPAQSPVCGGPNVPPPTRPVITGLFPAPLPQSHGQMFQPPAPGPVPLVNHQRPSCSWQSNVNNNGLLKVATQVERPASGLNSQPRSNSNTSGKICLVCGDDKGGLHYGVICCFACMDFFRRRVTNAINKRVERRAFNDCYNQRGQCVITRDTRNNCKFCRFQKCLNVGMRPDLVKLVSKGATSSEARRCQSAVPPMN